MSISTLVKRASRPASAIRSDTIIAIVASSHLATDILIGAFGATLPYLQGRFGLSGPHVAVLAAVLAATSSFGQPLAGRVADRVGPRDLAAGGAVVASTLLGLAASAPTFIVLVAVTAAGGLGAAAYQPAAASIARDAAAPGNPGWALGLYGADHVIDYTSQDFTEAAERYDLVLQVAGTHPASRLRRVLTPAGTLVQISGDSQNRWVGPLGRIIAGRLQSIFVGQTITSFTVQPNRDDLDLLASLIEDEALRTQVDHTCTLDDLGEALERMETGRTRGKVTVTITADGNWDEVDAISSSPGVRQ